MPTVGGICFLAKTGISAMKTGGINMSKRVYIIGFLGAMAAALEGTAGATDRFDYEKIGECDGGQVVLDRYKRTLWSDGPSRTETLYQVVFAPEKRQLLKEMGFRAPEDPNGQFIFFDLVYLSQSKAFETSRGHLASERSRLILDTVDDDILISQDEGFGSNAPRIRLLRFGNCVLY